MANIMLVDSHCHLESQELLGDIDSLLEKAADAGIVKLITSSVTRDEWAVSRGLAERYPLIEYSAGVHPWYVTENDLAVKEQLNAEAGRGMIAVGEIGLDRKITTPSFKLQLRIFTEQMEFAVDCNMPVIIHCRGAFNELIECINRTGVPGRGGTVHAFSGSVEIAETLMKKGLSFSIGGTLTYRNSKKRSDVLRRIYPDNFLLETDSPDIPPAGMEKPNMPHNILFCLAAAAEILGVSEERLAENTTRNASRIFDLEII